MPDTNGNQGLSYSDAGVNINAGNTFVERIKPAVKRTSRAGVIGGLGGFGGLFELPLNDYKKPVLVSGTDGVGTKLKLAIDLKKYNTVGIDLVAMCVNDIIVTGAEPLFFLDYYASGQLDIEAAATVVEGIAEGCIRAGAALVGGETAEMPGIYARDDFDLAGFAVGIAEKDRILDYNTVKAGDVIIGIESSGPHSNGFSLIRKVLEFSGCGLEMTFDGKTLGETLLEPTKIYVKPILRLLESVNVHALAHITGGGLPENLPRVIPKGLTAMLDHCNWQQPEIFTWLQSQGKIEDSEMYRTFNCGIGMVAVIDASDQKTVVDMLAADGETRPPYWCCKKIRHIRISTRCRNQMSTSALPRIAVLISGRGSNMQSIVTACQSGQIAATVCCVISNEPRAKGLIYAHDNQIQTESINHRDFPDRESFDRQLVKKLNLYKPNLVVLAGFMRILTPVFTNEFANQVLNIHPSLLPKYPGLNTHQRALEAGDAEHGASVHFVTTELDSGPVIIQGIVDVKHDDTLDTLAAKVLRSEHVIYPKAVEWVINSQACTDW